MFKLYCENGLFTIKFQLLLELCDEDLRQFGSVRFLDASTHGHSNVDP